MGNPRQAGRHDAFAVGALHCRPCGRMRENMNPRAWVNAPSLLSTSLGCHGLGLLPLSGGASNRREISGANNPKPTSRMHHQSAAPAWCSDGEMPTATGTFGTPSMRPALNPFGMVPKRLSRGKARNPRFFEPWSCVSNYQTPGPRAPVFSHE
jgi:hypothetical protein